MNLNIKVSDILNGKTYPKLLGLYKHLRVYGANETDLVEDDMKSIVDIFKIKKNPNEILSMNEEFVAFILEIIEVSECNFFEVKEKKTLKNDLIKWLMKNYFCNLNPIISTCCTVSEAIKNETFKYLKPKVSHENPMKNKVTRKRKPKSNILKPSKLTKITEIDATPFNFNLTSDENKENFEVQQDSTDGVQNMNEIFAKETIFGDIIGSDGVSIENFEFIESPLLELTDSPKLEELIQGYLDKNQ